MSECEECGDHIEDPALMVMTAALANDWDYADRVASEYLDAGHGDILVEGLVNMTAIFVHVLAHLGVNMTGTHDMGDHDEHVAEVAEWWATWCTGIAAAEAGDV